MLYVATTYFPSFPHLPSLLLVHANDCSTHLSSLNHHLNHHHHSYPRFIHSWRREIPPWPSTSSPRLVRSDIKSSQAKLHSGKLSKISRYEKHVQMTKKAFAHWVKQLSFLLRHATPSHGHIFLSGRSLTMSRLFSINKEVPRFDGEVPCIL